MVLPTEKHRDTTRRTVRHRTSRHRTPRHPYKLNQQRDPIQRGTPENTKNYKKEPPPTTGRQIHPPPPRHKHRININIADNYIPKVCVRVHSTLKHVQPAPGAAGLFKTGNIYTTYHNTNRTSERYIKVQTTNN